jgi:hypothetical protein
MDLSPHYYCPGKAQQRPLQPNTKVWGLAMSGAARLPGSCCFTRDSISNDSAAPVQNAREVGARAGVAGPPAPGPDMGPLRRVTTESAREPLHGC